VPAGGFAVRTRAASGHHLAGKRTGLRGARWTGQARGGQNTRPSRVPGNVVLELSQRRLRLRWRVPRRSAGRRARPDWRAAAKADELRRLRTCLRCADNGWHAPFGAPPPFFAGGEPLRSGVVVGETRARMRRGKDFAYPPPRSETERGSICDGSQACLGM
jgi:hypothetical protein